MNKCNDCGKTEEETELSFMYGFDEVTICESCKKSDTRCANCGTEVDGDEFYCTSCA